MSTVPATGNAGKKTNPDPVEHIILLTAARVPDQRG
jgi:hypothetical protein